MCRGVPGGPPEIRSRLDPFESGPLSRRAFWARESGGEPRQHCASICGQGRVGIPLANALRQRLLSDAVLRKLCGWQQAKDVPGKWTFSCAFQKFAKSEVPQRAHEALIQRAYENRLVGHISRDATAVEARERPQRKPVTGRRGRRTANRRR